MKSAPQSINSGVTGNNTPQPQIRPQEVWSQLTPTQQQLVFQTLVLMCRHLLQRDGQTSRTEVTDEPS